MSALEARVSLVAALAIQASSLSQRRKCSNQLPPTHTLEAFKIGSLVTILFQRFGPLTCSFARVGHGDCKICLPQTV